MNDVDRPPMFTVARARRAEPPELWAAHYRGLVWRRDSDGVVRRNYYANGVLATGEIPESDK